MKTLLRISRSIATAVGLLVVNIGLAAETALDRYVHTPDPAYRYESITNSVTDNGTTHWIKFTSQSWLTAKEVNRTNWWHWLVIHRPKEAVGDTALLFITGGSNRDERPPRPDTNLERIADATKTVVVQLRQVPNQPLIFHNDGEERTEDDLIAYGWDKFLRGGSEEWLARLPMTKSAVRAMDTITDFLAQPEQGGLKIDKFVVAGASKRGWTTWTTAAVDQRVVAIAPIVIDMLNVVPSFKHHWEAYGFYAPAVGDYEHHGIMHWQDTPEYARLLSIVEPYEYRDRLTMPKLMINATGDQFFLPDSHRFFFDDLKGPKYLRYVPNADHSLRDTDAVETIAAWLYATTRSKPLPQFDWKVDWQRGEITVQLKDKPAEIHLWQATNPEARDFRIETLGKVWTNRELTADDQDRIVAHVEKPAKGWTAFLVELTYPVAGSPTPLKLTSGVAVVPDVLPFEGKMPKGRKVAITIDDGPAVGTSGDLKTFLSISDALRESFVTEKVPAIMFINEQQLHVEGQRDQRVEVVRKWLDAGLDLGNHTYSHPHLSQMKIWQYTDDILKGEVISRPLLEARDQKLVWFRYPFLDSGRGDTAKAVEDFLAQRGYRIAPVTVSYADYSYAGEYAKHIRSSEKEKADELFATMMNRLDESFARAETRSREVLGHELPQILLIHCNEMNALTLGATMQRIRDRGYRFVSLDEAMQDPAYHLPGIRPGGLGGGGVLNTLAAANRKGEE